jgi:hypothetical protein
MAVTLPRGGDRWTPFSPAFHEFWLVLGDKDSFCRAHEPEVAARGEKAMTSLNEVSSIRELGSAEVEVTAIPET